MYSNSNFSFRNASAACLSFSLIAIFFASGCGILPQKEVEPDLWRVVLRWQTETESNAFGYYVYRANSPEEEMVCINEDNPLHAGGTTDIPHRYVFFDLNVEPEKTYYYKLKSVDLDGEEEWIIGGTKPVPGKPKIATKAERKEIETKGSAYREEAGRS